MTLCIDKLTFQFGICFHSGFFVHYYLTISSSNWSIYVTFLLLFWPLTRSLTNSSDSGHEMATVTHPENGKSPPDNCDIV